MIHAQLANVVLLLHLGFIIYVVFGGLLLHRFPRLMLLHLPAVVWATLVEFTGWACPLTPLENQLRRLAGEAGFESGFIAHYLLPIIYPHALTREIQWVLGGGVVLINAAAYVWWFRAGKPDAQHSK